MIEAKVLLDSIQSSGGERLTTFMMTLPRCLLAEANTHRALSKNAASSRAIPVLKRMNMVEVTPFIPVEWGLDKAGMQATAIATPEVAAEAEAIWLEMRDHMLDGAKRLSDLGIHKQIVNRLLETFTYVTVLITGVEAGWQNFFSLRAEFHADPSLRALVFKALAAYNASIPQVLAPGEWHIPFGDNIPAGLTPEERIKVVVARAARTSYNNFDGTSDMVKDFALHDILADNGHWSAFEHVAMVPDESSQRPLLSGNLTGWVQLRKLYPNEFRRDSRVLETRVVDGIAIKVTSE